MRGVEVVWLISAQQALGVCLILKLVLSTSTEDVL